MWGNFEIHRLILLAALIIAAVTDCKSRKIPIPLFPITVCTDVLVRVCMRGITRDLILGLVTGLIAFFVYVLFALFAKGGGGDAIMMGGIGVILGLLDTLKVIAYAGIIYICAALIVHIVRKKKLSHIFFPYAPFILSGYILLEVIHLIKGGL